MKFRVAKVLSDMGGAGGVAQEENPVGIAAIVTDMAFDPLDNHT